MNNPESQPGEAMDLDAIEARIKKIEPFGLPDKRRAELWEKCEPQSPDVYVVYGQDASIEAAICQVCSGEQDNAAVSEFIAHARQDIPALIAENRRLRSQRATDDEVIRLLNLQLDEFQSSQAQAKEEKIRTRCPSCHHETLFIGSGGWLTCSLIGCKDPTLITRMGEIPAAIPQERKPRESEAMRMLLEIFFCKHCHDHFSAAGEGAVECRGCRQLWPLSALPTQALLFCPECGGSGEITEEDVIRCPKCDGSRVREVLPEPPAAKAPQAVRKADFPYCDHGKGSSEPCADCEIPASDAQPEKDGV